MIIETSTVKVYRNSRILEQQQNYQNFFEEGRRYYSCHNLNINFPHLKTYNFVIVLC